MAAEIGKTKRTVATKVVNEALVSQVHSRVAGELENLFDASHMKADQYNGIDELRETSRGRTHR